MAYTIGLPPRNNVIPNSNSWLDVKKNYLKITFTPLKLNVDSLAKLSETLNGTAVMESADDEFKKRFKDLIGKTDVNVSSPLNVYVMSEAPFTDTYSNNIANITLIGQLADYAANSKIGRMMSAANRSGIKVGNILAKAGLSAADFISKFSGMDVTPGKNTQLDMKALSEAIMNKKDVGLYLKNAGVNEEVAEAVGQGWSTFTSILAGNKPIFPEIWSDSNYSCGYNYSVRLYNPNPANKKMHVENIVAPMTALMALTLPKLDPNSTSTYSSPLYVTAYCPGLFKLQYGMITNLTVVKGGDENAISFNGRPSIVDLRFTITPIYSKRIISKDNKEGISQGGDIKEMIGEEPFKEKEKNMANKEKTAKTNSEPVQSKEAPSSRIDYNLKFQYEQTKPD